uniref:3.7 kDa salivary protein n=1 Tax=Phlebotomus tobbi TaxID=33402 RepID=F6JYG9_9DIPT
MKYFSLNFLFIVILLIVACSPQLPCLPQNPQKKPCKEKPCPNQRPSLSGKGPSSY